MDNLNEQFSQIYDQYIDKIYRFVYLKVSSQEIAEDITSKVFIKGWESYQKQSSEIKNPGAFLYQIARNTVVDYYREKRRVHVISADMGQEISDKGESAYDKAVLSADIDVVKKAIQKLKKDHQDVIVWHYIDDMPINNIAEMISKPSGTVRVMLHRGLKELRDIINES